MFQKVEYHYWIQCFMTFYGSLLIFLWSILLCFYRTFRRQFVTYLFWLQQRRYCSNTPVYNHNNTSTLYNLRNFSACNIYRISRNIIPIMSHDSDISIWKTLHTRGPFYKHGFNHDKVWDEITYPFPNFNVQPLKFGNGWIILYHIL